MFYKIGLHAYVAGKEIAGFIFLLEELRCVPAGHTSYDNGWVQLG